MNENAIGLVERLREKADYHDNKATEAEAFDAPDSAKYHDEHRLLLIEAANALSALPPLRAREEICDDTSALQDDLRDMLRALGLPDGARPQSPHEIFRECIEAVKAIKAREPQSSAEYHQKRGAAWDIVDEALIAYREFMLDDDYDAITALKKICDRMEERRALYSLSRTAGQEWRDRETMIREFIHRQGEKLRTIEGSIAWRNGYGAALDAMTRVLDAVPAQPVAEPIVAGAGDVSRETLAPAPDAPVVSRS
jgi:hypothetical protein